MHGWLEFLDGKRHPIKEEMKTLVLEGGCQTCVKSLESGELISVEKLLRIKVGNFQMI